MFTFITRTQGVTREKTIPRITSEGVSVGFAKFEESTKMKGSVLARHYRKTSQISKKKYEQRLQR